MNTWDESYNELRPEDKAFIDGFYHAIKYVENEGLTEDAFMPELAENSILSQVIQELIKLVKDELVCSMAAEGRDLILGTLDSYED